MAIESIEFYPGSPADEEWEAEPDAFIVTFSEAFINRNYEPFIDGSLAFRPDELEELHQKIGEAIDKERSS